MVVSVNVCPETGLRLDEVGVLVVVPTGVTDTGAASEMRAAKVKFD
jgi:hypothetical protein